MANYDYVVLGAGSAGCVVAARLSEDAGINVAVLEAGGRQVPPVVAEDIAIPWHWGLVQNTTVDWTYQSVPQAHCFGRRFPEPRGRMPGGTSNLYALMHIRGHRSDYDNWAYNGCPGWGFDDVLRYFQKLEDQEEYLVLFKCTTSTVKELKSELKGAHPYDVPEIVEIRMNDVSESYLSWLAESTIRMEKRK